MANLELSLSLPLRDYFEEENMDTEERALVNCFNVLSSNTSLEEKMDACKELEVKTRTSHNHRVVFKTNYVSRLIKYLKSEANADPKIEERIISVLLNLLLLESNTDMVAETPHLIDVVIEATASLHQPSRSKAINLLHILAMHESARNQFHPSMMKYLVHILEEGDSDLIRRVARTLTDFSLDQKFTEAILQANAVEVIVKKINDFTIPSLLMLPLLALSKNLSKNPAVAAHLATSDAVHCMIKILDASACITQQERALDILGSCTDNDIMLQQIVDYETSSKRISQLASVGNVKIQHLAQRILRKMKAETHTS